MPRSQGSSGRSSRSSSPFFQRATPTPRAPVTLPPLRPPPVLPAAPAAPAVPVSEPPSIFSSMKQGFGFGIGNSIAMNIFRSDPKPTAGPQPTTPSEVKEYMQCLEKNNNDKELCKQYIHD